jgi:epsin
MWVSIEKAIDVLDYLIRNGSERVIDETRDKIFLLKQLQNFHVTNKEGKEKGGAIRERCKMIVELISDTERLREVFCAACI